MIKMVLAIALVVAAALLIGHTTITLSPFSVKMLKPLSALGLILVSFGYAAFAYGEYKSGYNQAVDDVCAKLESIKAETKDSVETEAAIETADSVK